MWAPIRFFWPRRQTGLYVINGDNTVSTYIALNPLSSLVSTITLPPGTVGVRPGAGSNGDVYVANGGGTAASNNVPMISAQR